MGEKLIEANDNDKPIIDCGPFPLDRGIDFWPILNAKPGQTVLMPVPWGDGFMLCRE